MYDCHVYIYIYKHTQTHIYTYANVCDCVTILSCYGSIPLTLGMIGKNSSLSTVS